MLEISYTKQQQKQKQKQSNKDQDADTMQAFDRKHQLTITAGAKPPTPPRSAKLGDDWEAPMNLRKRPFLGTAGPKKEPKTTAAKPVIRRQKAAVSKTDTTHETRATSVSRILYRQAK